MAEANSERNFARLSELAVEERPQEKQERMGPRSLSDAELLAMILRSGSEGHDVLQVARSLLSAGGGSLGALLHLNADDLKCVKGIGRVKAQQLLSVLEIARRVLEQSRETVQRVDTVLDVVRLLEAEAFGLSVERLWVLCLNRRNGLIRIYTATSGTANSSLAHPREVFREAIKAGASSIICAHNHPSGDPTPSPSDFTVTRQLRDAGKLLDLKLRDHVILGTASGDPSGLGYFSFKAAGVVD